MSTADDAQPKGSAESAGLRDPWFGVDTGWWRDAKTRELVLALP